MEVFLGDLSITFWPIPMLNPSSALFAVVVLASFNINQQKVHANHKSPVAVFRPVVTLVLNGPFYPRRARQHQLVDDLYAVRLSLRSGAVGGILQSQGAQSRLYQVSHRGR